MLQGKVLIVDADAAGRAALCEAAGRLGFQALPAAGGEEGLGLARQHAPRFAVGPADEPGFGDGGVLEALPAGAVLLVVDTPGFPALPLPGLLRVVAGSREQRVACVSACLAALSAGLLPEPGEGVLHGELAEVGLGDLLQALATARFSGAVVCGDDGLTLAEGRPHAARAGQQRGQAAALALLLRRSGDCRLVFADPGPADPGLPDSVEALLAAAGVPAAGQPVLVVTDSTSDLAPHLARSHGIHVVPLHVHFGEQALKDGIDVVPASFYPMLRERRDHPHTSPPPKADFRAAYLSLPEGCAVVSVHISGKLSQTVLNARVAADLVRAAAGQAPRSFEVVDSLQVSAGLGFLALCAARLARRGVPPAEIRRRLQRMRSRVHLLFVVDTLEFLARGGRIGKASALLGGLLGIKPILGVVGGEVTPIDRVRGGKAAHPRLVELIRERVQPGRPLFAGVAHAAAPEWADRLAKLLAESFPLLETLRGEIGPVVGTHAGPGTVGCYVYQPQDDEEARLLAPLENALQSRTPAASSAR